MDLRTSLQQTRWITLAVLGVLIWTIVIWFEVLNTLDWTAASFVGQAGVSGVVGLLVLVGLFVLLVTLAAELGETDPAPESWPPE